MRHVWIGIGLVVLWVSLWGSVTAANVIGGVVVAILVLAAAPLGRPARGELELHPWHVLRFSLFFLWALVSASVVVALTIIRPRSDVTSGIIAVPLGTRSDALMTLIANAISLTPGTLTIESYQDPTTLYVHVLHVDNLDNVRRDIARLSTLAIAAFGSREDSTAGFRDSPSDVETHS
jgi:multicomponent Na+:H+ antiporter subunit E